MNRPKYTRGPGVVRDFINDQLIPWIQRGRPLRSPQCEIDEREDGTLILPNIRGGSSTTSASASQRHQFKIYVRKIGEGEAAVWKRGVEFRSTLQKDRQRGNNQTITGLLTEDAPADDDGGWGLAADGDDVWLEIAFSTWPTIATAQIKSTEIDGDMGPDIEHDSASIDSPNYTHLKARIRLGQIEITDDVATVRQEVKSPLVMAIFPTHDAYNSAGEDERSVIANYPIPLG